MQEHKPYGPYEKYIKRPLDLVLALTALVVLSPVMLIVAILVRIKLGTPVLFTQERLGKGERIFKLYKFRTMTGEKDEAGNLLSDEVRLTPFGRKLRSTSLDELPELLNIIRGDMAVIGPRPMPAKYLSYFKKEEKVIHSVRGGLVPPDVLTLHSVFDWDEQFQNEINYVEKISFLSDVKIVFATFIVLFKRNKTEYGGQVRKPLSEVRNYIKKGT